MNAFDKVIGYKATKRELLQLCDMPVTGRSMRRWAPACPMDCCCMATRLGQDAFGKVLCGGERAAHHHGTPRQGRRRLYRWNYTGLCQREDKSTVHCPLDDMDKFANEDDTHCDAPEYAAVQAGIDDVKDTGVFVIATANDIRKLPSSLRRSGRFDRKNRTSSAHGVRRGGDHHPLSENETGFGQCQHGRPDEDDAL